jgi:acyl carrier protein
MLMSREAKKAEIEQKVKEIIKDVLTVDEQRITPEASFTDDLNADSLEIVSLIMEFESAFDIEIPDQDVEERIVSVQDAVNYLAERLESKA